MTARSIVGVWKLKRSFSQYEDGPMTYPLGEDAFGYILYTADGYVTCSISRAGRAPFVIPDRMRGTPEEKARSFDDYITYFGQYRLDGDKVLHKIEVSLLPNWVGDEQVRKITWVSDDEVSLTGEWHVNGQRRVAVIEWERSR
jgi:Lipocalin-like domain